MKSFASFASLFLLMMFVFSVTAFAQTATTAPISEYDRLVAKLKAVSTDFADYRNLRIAAAREGRATSDLTAFTAAMTEKNFKEVARLAELALDVNYADIFAHISASGAYKNLGQTMKSDFHKVIASGFINSIMEGKDGLTPGSAFEVVSSREEGLVLGRLGYTNVNGASDFGIERVEGREYDVVNAKDPKTDKSVKFYFYNHCSMKLRDGRCRFRG